MPVSYTHLVEGLLKKLERPDRMLRLCGGDMSFTAALCFDFEVYSEAVSYTHLPCGIQLIGRDDRSNARRLPLQKLMARIDKSKPVILLEHQPCLLYTSSKTAFLPSNVLTG